MLPYLIVYLALAAFVSAVVARVLWWVRQPPHLRWELYPLPHEPAPRGRYGGSFMEVPEWWRQPRRRTRLGEVAAMAKEILLLHGVWAHNRPLWRWTFPFHLGLYLVASAVGLWLVYGLAGAVAPALLGGALGAVARPVILALGAGGFALGAGGALGLLVRRLTAPELRGYSAPADLFNLAFFAVAFGVGLVTIVLLDPDGARSLAFAVRLCSLDLVPPSGQGLERGLLVSSVLLLGALVAYVPLTHMSHFVGKFFAYHAIRWNDEAHPAGGRREAEIQALLQREVSWAARHVAGGGRTTWGTLVQGRPEEPPP
ncbi:MAG TPA: hypothetical protein PLU22_09240 [Polyangiaceae bacterium]|nr:hypothetical protein [Polyangiaceae bacterium]